MKFVALLTTALCAAFAAPGVALAVEDPGDNSSLNYGRIHMSCGGVDFKLTGEAETWTLTVKEDGKVVKVVKRTAEANAELVTIGLRASSDAPHAITAESTDGRSTFSQTYTWIGCGPSEGRAGSNGATGATGPTGPQGVTGARGPKGDRGLRGLRGSCLCVKRGHR